MKRKCLVMMGCVLVVFAKAQLSIDAEGGAATFGYNDVRISGQEGSNFSLKNDFDNKVSPYYRLRLQYSFSQRHSVYALFAPLTIKSSGIPQSDIYFQDALFEKGIKTDYSWKFNSYRLSYQYNVILKEHFILGLGITGKVRDAKIGLSNPGQSAAKTNVGIVPLLRFYMDWNFVDKMHLIVDGDALVGKQGRAEDVLLALGYNLSEALRIKLGYRLLEGGADNDQVYNFSSVHYASLSAVYTFK